MTDKIISQPLTTSSRLGMSRYQGKQLPYTAKILVFFFLQAVLALVIRQSNTFSTLHAYATVAAGLFFLVTDKEPSRLIYWMGYVAGAELLWRGTGANVFWETGKYAIILISGLGCLKNFGKHRFNFSLVPYFLLLSPAMFLMPSFNRETVAFALAGPFAIVASSIFFSRLEINTAQLKTLLLTVVASVLTFSILALVGLIDAEVIEFNSASNLFASANTGPNQVSSVLSLGAFAAFIYAFLEKDQKFLRFLVIALGIGLFVQITLTFSRGGLYTLLGAVAMGGFFFIRDQKARRSYILIVLASFLVFYFLLFPALEQFTSGALGARLRDTEPTGRIEIIQSDLEVFMENPVCGIGLGQSNYEHARYFRVSNAHTEYSRMLAEHGIFGLLSLLILVVVLGLKFLHKNEPVSKAVIVACMTWGLLFMAHSATRLVAPSFLIGLAFAHFQINIPTTESTREVRYSRFRGMRARHKLHRL